MGLGVGRAGGGRLQLQLLGGWGGWHDQQIGGGSTRLSATLFS